MGFGPTSMAYPEPGVVVAVPTNNLNAIPTFFLSAQRSRTSEFHQKICPLFWNLIV